MVRLIFKNGTFSEGREESGDAVLILEEATQTGKLEYSPDIGLIMRRTARRQAESSPLSHPPPSQRYAQTRAAELRSPYHFSDVSGGPCKNQGAFEAFLGCRRSGEVVFPPQQAGKNGVDWADEA